MSHEPHDSLSDVAITINGEREQIIYWTKRVKFYLFLPFLTVRKLNHFYFQVHSFCKFYTFKV